MARSRRRLDALHTSPVAPGRTATPRVSTVDSVTSAWPWRSWTDSATPGRSRQPGRKITTTGGLTALLVFRPRPGSPPRVRHPPRLRPRLLPHTRLFAWARPNPEPSYRVGKRNPSRSGILAPGDRITARNGGSQKVRARTASQLPGSACRCSVPQSHRAFGNQFGESHVVTSAPRFLRCFGVPICVGPPLLGERP